jgi:hypothetical protein
MTTSNFGKDRDSDEDDILKLEAQLREERLRGWYVIGNPDAGKSRLLTKQVLQDIRISLNPLSYSELKNHDAVQEDVDRVMHIFKWLWNIGKDTPRLENILRASVLTLAYNNLTIDKLPFLLKDKEFRKRCIDAIPVTFATAELRAFWGDFDEMYVQEQLKYADSTLNKILHSLTDRNDTF